MDHKEADALRRVLAVHPQAAGLGYTTGNKSK
jgi:hypothetical protein